MIQRIQTLYLLVADLLIATLFFLEIVLNTWPLLALTCLIFALLFLIIFQYKNRPLQIKLSYLAMLLSVGLTGLFYFYVWKGNTLTGGNYTYKLSFTFPLLAAVCAWLASRGMIKDENLIKSIDRIR
jgi:drug/metabolite transporter (DMT)-like permease